MANGQTRWEKCHRDPDKLITEIRRSCREKEIPLKERQNGSSHWVGKVPKGSMVVSRHGEIPKGTWGSIMRALVGLGIATIALLALLA
jgi:hypothetical protein